MENVIAQMEMHLQEQSSHWQDIADASALITLSSKPFSHHAILSKIKTFSLHFSNP